MSFISPAIKKQDSEEEGGVIIVSMARPSLVPEQTSLGTPGPTVPPPPPPLLHSGQQKRRVRSFYWKPIPEERVHQHGEPNLWTLGRSAGKHTFHIDIKTIEELFGQHESKQTPSTAKSSGSQSHSSLQEPRKEINILDSKRSMNVAIFLKRFKKTNQSIIEELLHGNTEMLGPESLRELLKLLPEPEEVEKLQTFRGDLSQLSTADSFMYQLTALPRCNLLVEALLLKEEFSSLFSSLKKDISTLRSATRELLSCMELHSILHLVLEAGNIMNAGGYGGDAVGFRLSSLLTLSETKANRPGMNLLHFVALEAKKTDDQLLLFPEKLLHVDSAARVSLENLDKELQSLRCRVENLKENIQNHSHLQQQQQLSTFLQDAAMAIDEVSRNRAELQKEGDNMIDFFCEDKETFKLDECFHIFQHFCTKFRKAVLENVKQEMRAESQIKRMKDLEEKHHSWVGLDKLARVFGSRCHSETDVQAALKMEGLLGPLRPHPLSPQSPLGQFGSLHRSRRWRHPGISNTDSSRSSTHSALHTYTSTDSYPVANTHTDTPAAGVTVHTHTLVPALQAFSFDPFPDCNHGNNPFGEHVPQECSQTSLRKTEDEMIPEDRGCREEPKNLAQKTIITLSTNQPQNLTEEEPLAPNSTNLLSPPMSLTDQSLDSTECTNQESDLTPNQQSLLPFFSEEPAACISNSTEGGQKPVGQSIIPGDKKPHRKPPGRTLKTVPPTSKPVKVLPKMFPSSSSQPSSSTNPPAPLQTLTPSESMRKVISLRRKLYNSRALEVPQSANSLSPQRSSVQSSSIQRSLIQRSYVKKMVFQQKPQPEEKICHSTMHALAQAGEKVAPSPQSKPSHSPAPHFTHGTVASTTRHAAVASSNLSVKHSTVTNSVKAPSLNRATSLRLVQSRVAPGVTSQTTNTRAKSVYLAPSEKKKSAFSKDSQDKPVRPAWR